jgi:hypothetical protein
MYGFCVFCYVVALALGAPYSLSIAAAFTLALALQMVAGTGIHFVTGRITALIRKRPQRRSTP